MRKRRQAKPKEGNKCYFNIEMKHLKFVKAGEWKALNAGHILFSNLAVKER